MKTKGIWTAVLDGPPVPIGRNIQIKAKVVDEDDPGRPIVILIPMSRGERFYRAFAKALAKGMGTRALLDSPEFSETSDGLGD